MWVLGWPLLPEVAKARGLVPADFSDQNCWYALMVDITKDPATTGLVEAFGAYSEGTTLAVVAISKDKKAKCKEEAEPDELPPLEVCKRIQRQVGAKSGPWWYEACTD